MNSGQKAALERLCPRVQWQVSMANLSSFRVGGQIEALVETEDSAELPLLLRWLAEEKIAWWVLGGGSNILFTSGMHEGVFLRLKGSQKNIRLREQDSPDVDGQYLVDVQAGVKLGHLLAWCARHNLSGLEYMAGIPGTVGGAVAMNAGAFGGCMGDRLRAVRCLNAQGEATELSASSLVFEYRQSVFPPEYQSGILITGATLALQRDREEVIRERMRGVIAQRRAKQPMGMPSAGSFFKNPPGDYAGRLIELAGLKGYSHGQAMVSTKHGNIIVNRGGASPEEILALMHLVQERVHQLCGVMLEPEVRLFC